MHKKRGSKRENGRESRERDEKKFVKRKIERG